MPRETNPEAEQLDRETELVEAVELIDLLFGDESTLEEHSTFGTCPACGYALPRCNCE